MRFDVRRPSRSQARRENVVPLINIVFLLLFFFLLTGTLRAPEPFPVELPDTRGSSTLR